MSFLLLPASVLIGCALWDSSPFRANVARLSDADADGVSVADGDCNDADPDVYPDAPDVCDGVDNDCDGETDEVLPDTVWCQDVDEDGYGDITHQSRTCAPGPGWVTDCGDCDDSNRAVHPDASESCNGIDDDCDGRTDPSEAEGSTTWYLDQDGDGFGASDAYTTSCEPPSGTVADSSDCDDQHDDTYPGAPEICNDGRLNDCTGDGTTCGWTGNSALATTFAAFIAGPDARNEFVGFGVGFIDGNADGVDDLILTSSGAMYGDSSAGALHVWYGAPAGERRTEDASAHVVGQPDLYLGSSLHGVSARRITDPSSGESRILVATEGFAPTFDTRGVVLAIDDALYGQRSMTPDDVYARGASDMESFGSTIAASDSILASGEALLIGAPYNSERGTYSGALYVTTPAAPDGEDALATILGRDQELIGGSVVAGHDLDGDGVDDLVLGTSYDGPPRIYRFDGPLSGRMTTDEADDYVAEDAWEPDTTILTPDVDGDGLADLATEGAYEVVLLGTRSSVKGTHEGAVLGLLLEEPPDGTDIDFAMAAGDAQGDGVPDLIVGVPYLDTPKKFGDRDEAGAVAIVPLDQPYEGSEYLRDVASAVFYGPDARAGVGSSVSVGDVNSDDFVDLVIGAPLWSSNGYPSAGGVWFILGGGI